MSYCFLTIYLVVVCAPVPAPQPAPAPPVIIAPPNSEVLK